LEDSQSVLEQAKRLIDERKPQASEQKRAAFALSVAYLVTGESIMGELGGPSVREHAASHQFGPGGRYDFDKAVELLISDDGPIFGPITDLHRQCWVSEHCFDDDPSDMAELEA
jgi:hypothetical protein